MFLPCMILCFTSFPSSQPSLSHFHPSCTLPFLPLFPSFYGSFLTSLTLHYRFLIPSLSSPFPSFLFSSPLTLHVLLCFLPSLTSLFSSSTLHFSLFLHPFLPFPFCIFLHLSSMFPFFFFVPPLLLSSPSFPLPHFPPLGSLPFSLRSFSSLPQFFPVRGRDQSGTYEACSGINQRCSEAS